MTVKVGLLGTGYAAYKRAETLSSDTRVELLEVTGHDPEHTKGFGQTFQVSATKTWEAIIHQANLDLIIIANANAYHGEMVQAALLAGKHVMVEYPLCLDIHQAGELIQLARKSGLMLHVEHIELLGGLHRSMEEYLPKIVPTLAFDF